MEIICSKMSIWMTLILQSFLVQCMESTPIMKIKAVGNPTDFTIEQKTENGGSKLIFDNPRSKRSDETSGKSKHILLIDVSNLNPLNENQSNFNHKPKLLPIDISILSKPMSKYFQEPQKYDDSLDMFLENLNHNGKDSITSFQEPQKYDDSLEMFLDDLNHNDKDGEFFEHKYPTFERNLENNDIVPSFPFSKNNGHTHHTRNIFDENIQNHVLSLFPPLEENSVRDNIESDQSPLSPHLAMLPFTRYKNNRPVGYKSHFLSVLKRSPFMIYKSPRKSKMLHFKRIIVKK